MINRFLILIFLSLMLSSCANNDNTSGDVYSARETKKIQNVSYGTLISIRPIKIQDKNNNEIIGTISGAIVGGFLGNTIGGGTGRNLATAGGIVLGGVAGKGIQDTINQSNGVELEIHQDNGHTIVVVQKQNTTRYSVGQRVMIVSYGKQVTISPR
ncbi:hypothetical protein [Pantoea sp. Aalb]|uniref:outer membrane lipoprotein n=1 Tax=Pantoea sp. Aalb TaxID=2576762 RepID=UPI0013266C40|nr:hypothetical protein [Pantoea sp. Aalb]MXP67418.1 hypothetical protein [Pantoea sp. Aalb]